MIAKFDSNIEFQKFMYVYLIVTKSVLFSASQVLNIRMFRRF